MYKMKKGVSLVTVLLFMMVATIAATATYKWLSSVGASSAARLQLNEARSAAQSGIDAVRSWMTFKGNDLGAVVQQYLEESQKTGSKKPILLNSVLPRLKSSKMNDSVWLVGVNVENSTYKLKVLSVGTTRDNVKYSEIAIFSVNGLYQVDIPSVEAKVNYSDAFHGGIKAADVIDVSSGFIKSTPNATGSQGQLLNSIKSTDYLILDGDFYVNNNSSVKNLYVTGDFSFGNSVTVGGNLYVGKTLYGTMTSSKMAVSGSTYLNGGMKVNEKSPYVLNSSVYGFTGPIGGQFDFHGNVTSNGDIDHFRDDVAPGPGISYIKMHENLVLNGKLKFYSAHSRDGLFQVYHNVYVRDNSTLTGSVDLNYSDKTLFGSSSEDLVYLSNFKTTTDYNVCDNTEYKCRLSNNENIYVRYKGEFKTPSPDVIEPWWNADSMVKYREMISSERLDECDFSKDPIQFNTAILNAQTTLADDHRMGCNEEIWHGDNKEFPVELLNTCYNKILSEGQLYDKTWLVVKWSKAPQWSSTNNKLNGNFIFVFDVPSAPLKELQLPETESDAKVMVYLPSGWKNTTNGTGIVTDQNKSNAVYNYFIYSADDIGRFASLSAAPIKGSVYMEGCSVMNTLGTNNTIAIRFNEDLFKKLVNSSVICEYDGSEVCSAFTGGSPAIVGLDPNITVDPYHIATSTQLIVEIESQYKNNEPTPTSTQYKVVAPSEVVLPRIIYLPQDARGALKDYYSVIELNGSRYSKEPEKMTCPSEIPTLQKFQDVGTMKEGKYLCTYGSSSDKLVPVYVVVEGRLSENPLVKFHDDDEDKEIASGHSVDVRLVTTPSDAPVTVNIEIPATLLQGWSVTPIHSGLTYMETKNDHKIYSLTLTPDGTDIPVFKVSATEDAELGGVQLRLRECEHCILTQPLNSYVHITNRAKLKREDVEGNCGNVDNVGDFLRKYGFECSELRNIPACDFKNLASNPWVTANGGGCFPLEENELWNCYTGGTSVTLDSLLIDNDFCTVYIPPQSVTLVSAEGMYKLPASLKRKRASLTIKFVGKETSLGVTVNRSRPGAPGLPDTTCTSECTINLFAGDTVMATAGSDVNTDKFSYWTCAGHDCPHNKDEHFNYNPTRIILTGHNDTLTAHYNQKDMHCFYTNFEDFKNDWCSSEKESKQCMDKCKSGMNCSVADANYGGHYKGSDWLMVYQNNENSYSMPQVGGGKIMHPDGFGKRVIAKKTTGKPSVVLNRVEAGANGMMTAMLKIPSTTSENFEKIAEFTSEYFPFFNVGELLINDGLVIRSNASASEYFTLNIVTRATLAYARLCYVNGQENDYEKCQDEVIKSGPNENWIATASRLTRLTLNVDVKDDKIKVILSKNYLAGSVESGMAVAEFDLSSSELQRVFGTKNGNPITLNDDMHQYVGFKLGYPYKFIVEIFGILLWEYSFASFEIYDIGWRSYDYDEDCWDTPKVSCSFKANYTGGMVPDSMDVTPWVGMSSWFDGKDKDCHVKYYYNGCDLEDNHFAENYSILGWRTNDNDLRCNVLDPISDFFKGYRRQNRGKGFFTYSARELERYGHGRLKSDKYYFYDEGYHGYAYSTGRKSGFVNEASVIVSCKRSSENDNAHIYDASCGDFIVGEYEQCDESYEEMLTNNSTYCISTGSGECNIALDSVYNVREASVTLTLDDPLIDDMKVYLLDIDGNVSAASIIKAGESEFTIDVESISDSAGFNPQRVESVRFTSVPGTFLLTHVRSNCKYAFSLSCKEPIYNSMTEMWKVGADVVHPERADRCQIVGLYAAAGADIPDPRPCDNYLEEFEQKDLFRQPTQQSYTFRIEALDIHGKVLDTCRTSTKIINPPELTCQMSPNSLEQGFGVPAITFSVANCPPEGCPYTITFPPEMGVDPVTGTYVPGEQVVKCPNDNCQSVNTPEDLLPSGNYSYEVDVYGAHCPVGSSEFVIEREPDKATCSNQKIVGNTFTADIAFDTDRYWNGSIAGSVKMVYTDYIGNVIAVDGQKIPSIRDTTGKMFDETLKRKKEVHFSYNLPETMAKCARGVCKYRVSLLLYGGAFCSETWTVRNFQGLNSNCPNITGQNSANEVSFFPKMSGCEDDTSCTWSIYDKNGYELKSGSNYNGLSELKFSGGNAAGSRTYKFKVSATDLEQVSDSCEFTVEYTNEHLDVSNCGFIGIPKWGESATYSFTTNCENCDYEIKSGSGVGYSGKTNENAGNSTEAFFNVSAMENFTLTVNGQKIEECTKQPSFESVNATCNIGNGVQELYTQQTATFSASFSDCPDGSCNWPWVLKKNDGEIASGTAKSNVSLVQTVTGGGKYKLYLNGSSDPACEVDVANTDVAPSGVGTCSFDKSEYKYGEKGATFKVNSVLAYNENWSIKNGTTEFGSGTGLNKRNEPYEYTNKNFVYKPKNSDPHSLTFVYELGNSGKKCEAVYNMAVPSISCNLYSFLLHKNLDVNVANCPNCSFIVYRKTSKKGSYSQYKTGTATSESTTYTYVDGYGFRVVLEDGSEGTCD